MKAPTPGVASQVTRQTRLWLDEDRWVQQLYKSPANISPRFWTEDLISACVSLVLESESGLERLFIYLTRRLVLRDPRTKRHAQSVWLDQYALLQRAQRSPANQHPNPVFQLDQLTTACVALARESSPDGSTVFQQARVNMAARASRTVPLVN